MHGQRLLLHARSLRLQGKGERHRKHIRPRLLPIRNGNLQVGPVYACVRACFQTQLMYKWVQPKICSETVKGAVKLPPSGKKQSCPPCNPGFFFTQRSTCERCHQGSYSNGTGVQLAKSSRTGRTRATDGVTMKSRSYESVRLQTASGVLLEQNQSRLLSTNGGTRCRRT